MPKSRKLVKEVAESFVRDLKKRLPIVEPEITFESIGGGDVWVRVGVPSDLVDEIYDDIADATFDLNYHYWEDTGVFVVSTIEAKEAVNG